MTDIEDKLKSQIDQVSNSNNLILEASHRFLDVISPAVDAICERVEVRVPNRQMVFRCIIKRAQENLGMIISTVESQYPYMGTMPLRPLCEDLIYGTWLRSLPEKDADELILLSTAGDILKSMGAQNRFLPKAYADFGKLPDGASPHVRIPGVRSVDGTASDPNETQLFQNKQALKALGAKLGWPKGKMPTIHEMAQQSGLSEVYDFFYHGSSKAVHSNLHNMMRMVWEKSHDGYFSITSNNFDNYHRVFSLTYGIWLVAEIIERIAIQEFPEEFKIINGMEYAVWHAMVVVGLARNGALPPLVTERELRWSLALNLNMTNLAA